VLDGRSRVDGIALGASGNITPAWTVFANYTYLDSEVLQSVSDFCLASGGPAAPTAPRPIRRRAGHAADAEALGQPVHHLRAAVRLEVGYGLTYQGSFALNNQVLATAC
jgi:catecholate siderophore receptor